MKEKTQSSSKITRSTSLVFMPGIQSSFETKSSDGHCDCKIEGIKIIDVLNTNAVYDQSQIFCFSLSIVTKSLLLIQMKIKLGCDLKTRNFAYFSKKVIKLRYSR